MAGTKVEDFSFFDVTSPMLVGGISADIINDANYL